MNIKTLREHHRALEHAAWADAAKQHAMALRAEAIDAFWMQLGARIRSAWRMLRRAASRPPVRSPRETTACPR